MKSGMTETRMSEKNLHQDDLQMTETGANKALLTDKGQLNGIDQNFLFIRHETHPLFLRDKNVSKQYVCPK